MAISPDLGTPEEAAAETGPAHKRGRPAPLEPTDVIKTYRYLRIGMIGAVVLLAVSIGMEHSQADCWQNSISAYYYTPVRAIFVGSLMAVGLSLIVYKGRSRGEDPCLNFAGMFAPVVAIVPTKNVGTCWSIEPRPSPVKADGSLDDWVVAHIDNNFHALLIAGALGLAATAVIALWLNRQDFIGAARAQYWTTASLIGTGVALLAAWWMITYWGGFYARAHVYAAFAMFNLLIAAIVFVTIDTRHRRPYWWKWYAGVAVLMVLGAAFIGLSNVFGEHKVLVLEAYEIILFGIYWSIQTAEKWDEHVRDTGPTTVTATVAPAPGSPPSALIP
jgi:hypothetical protein